MEDLIGYSRLIDTALRGVIRDVLKMAQNQGLPGEHHLYVTFRTDFPGLLIADHLKEKYPEEMTIVLQHQYWNLKVEEKTFSIVLSFNKIREKLIVPFAAITSFVDPSIKFGLQLQQVTSPATAAAHDDSGQLELQEIRGGEKTAKIISLDSFRKGKG